MGEVGLTAQHTDKTNLLLFEPFYKFQHGHNPV